MGIMSIRKRLVAGTIVVAGLAAGAAFAGPTALAGLGLGRWQLRGIGIDADPAGTRALCVRDPMQFIQLNHPGLQCTRFTLDDGPNHVTIHYTCPGKGYGRTTVTVEDSNLIKVDTQGIGPDGQPFGTVYEGRLTGTCAPPATPPRR